MRGRTTRSRRYPSDRQDTTSHNVMSASVGPGQTDVSTFHNFTPGSDMPGMRFSNPVYINSPQDNEIYRNPYLSLQPPSTPNNPPANSRCNQPDFVPKIAEASQIPSSISNYQPVGPGKIKPGDKTNPWNHAGLIAVASEERDADYMRAHAELETLMRSRQNIIQASSLKLQEMTDARCLDNALLPEPQSSSHAVENSSRSARAMVGGGLDALAMCRLGQEMKPQPGHGIEKLAAGFRTPGATSDMTRPLRNRYGSKTRGLVMGSTGLRENLLRHGRQSYGNQTKIDLRNLSFHDWSPLAGSDVHGNRLMMHLEGGGQDGCNITLYEVDIPSVNQPLILGPKPLTDRWIWFLISTPVIDLSRLPSDMCLPIHHSRVPVNIIVFAAPFTSIQAAHVIHGTISRQTENVHVAGIGADIVELIHPSKTLNISQSTPVTVARNARYSCPSSPDAQVLLPVKRLDFDFSHHGIPAFEFSSARNHGLDVNNLPKLYDMNLEDGTISMKGLEFASARVEMRHFERWIVGVDTPMSPDPTSRDAVWEVDSEEEDKENIFPHEPHNPGARLNRQYTTSGQAPDGNTPERYGGRSITSPHIFADEEKFWAGVRRAAAENVDYWKEIRECMARGYCRVIARVDSETKQREGSCAASDGGDGSIDNSSQKRDRDGFVMPRLPRKVLSRNG